MICEENEIQITDNNPTISASSLISAHSPKVLLMTASVYVKGIHNKNVPAHLLIDGGSQRSYIRSSFSELLKADILNTEQLQILVKIFIL